MSSCGCIWGVFEGYGNSGEVIVGLRMGLRLGGPSNRVPFDIVKKKNFVSGRLAFPVACPPSTLLAN